MTSQKRYRHHQDGNNSNNTRYRDLPPRFKRQKSSTSPTPSEKLPATPSANAEKDSSELTHSEAPQTSHTAAPVTTMAPSPHMVGEQVVGQANSRSDIMCTPGAVSSSPSLWGWAPQTDAQVLSPVDNRSPRRSSGPNSPSGGHISLGTHFGYVASSPPMSPWATGNGGNFSGQSGLWSPPRTDQFRHQQVRSPPGFMNNENMVPSQRLMQQHSPNSPWEKSVVSPQPQNSPSLKSSLPADHGKARTDMKQSIDYSDPDIRTIEMLRELERVADEKESETDGGTDRKSLVSHHLRMLMCAVDRYTEGIEDDFSTISRGDEVTVTADSPRSTPVPSPGPSKGGPHGLERESSKKISSDSSSSQWGQHLDSSPFWMNTPVTSTVSPTSFHTAEAPGQHRMRNHQNASFLPQASSPMWREQSQPQRLQTSNWDLWSGTSLDVYGMLSKQGSNGMSPLDVFDSAITSRNQQGDRKPLYLR